MLTDFSPDMVVAFPGGKGTADMVRQAKAKNFRVVEVAQAELGSTASEAGKHE
jgi:hypothetical protein